MAEVVPFPMARRRAYVARQAAHIATMNDLSGERYLRKQVEMQADVMARRGVAPEVIARECATLRTAVRGALWVLVMQGGTA